MEGRVSTIFNHNLLHGLITCRHGNDADSSTKEQKDTAPKPKTSRQKWAVYISEHDVGDKKLSTEPDESINQTDSKTHFSLTPGDLACLPHFPKPNPKYGNTTKLFDKDDVQKLAYRKAAVVEGIDETGDTEAFLSKGKALLESAVATPEEA